MLFRDEAREDARPTCESTFSYLKISAVENCFNLEARSGPPQLSRSRISISFEVISKSANHCAFMKFLFTFLSALLIATTGCVSSAKKLDPKLVERIQESARTRGDIEQLLGRPKATQTGSQGTTLAYYEFQQARKNPGWSGVFKGEAGSILFRTFTVLYHDDVVAKVLFGQSLTPVKYEERGISAGRNVTDDGVHKIIKGITSRGELIQWFGSPTLRTLNLQGDVVLCWLYMDKYSKWTSDSQKRDFRVVLDRDDFVTNFDVLGMTRGNFAPFR